MPAAIERVPTLGEFHKVVCDSLRLWSDDGLEAVFNVPATETERRRVLKDAFAQATKNEQGGISLAALVDKTRELSPEDKQISKQIKTIRAYVNQYAKNDFCSIHEFIEFQHYIVRIIKERFPEDEAAKLAKNYYLSALEYYREWVREFVIEGGAIPEAYQYFINNVLKSIVISWVSHHALDDLGWLQHTLQDDWPMRRLIDELLGNADKSVYQLCQYHEQVKGHENRNTDIEVEGLKGENINSAAKQVLERLSRFTKVKWRIYFQTIKPLQRFLPYECDDAYFTASALGAFIIHNLNIHLNDNWCEALWDQEFSYPLLGETSMRSISHVFDEALEQCTSESEFDQYVKISHEKLIQYHHALERHGLSINKEYQIPPTLGFAVGRGEQFSVTTWSERLPEKPDWLKHWVLAKMAVENGEPIVAAKHFSKVLSDAKYCSGPLWIQLFFEVCSLCQKEGIPLGEEIRSEHFDPLGEQVISFAQLLGYLPYSGRNPRTLMPNPATVKEQLMINKLNQLVSLN